MKRLNTILLGLLLAFSVFANMVSHGYVKERRSDLAFKYESPDSGVPTALIQILSGEFRDLMADYLLLEVGSFIGSNQKLSREDYLGIHRALKQILELDPYFKQAYLYAQGVLPWAGHLPEKAIELLEVSRAHRTWDWRPGHYAGFDYYYFLNDFGAASNVFLETAKIKDAPVLMAVLGARFALKDRRTESALVLLKTMLQDKAMPPLTRSEIEDRVTALSGVLALEKAIDLYKRQSGAYPPSLETLLETGLISEMPVNPYDKHYFYDAPTGRVNFDTVKPEQQRLLRESRTDVKPEDNRLN